MPNKRVFLRICAVILADASVDDGAEHSGGCFSEELQGWVFAG
jgi:hypothetical protein